MENTNFNLTTPVLQNISWSGGVKTTLSLLCDKVLNYSAKVYIQKITPVQNAVKVNLRVAITVAFEGEDQVVDTYQSAAEYPVEIANEQISENSLVNLYASCSQINLVKVDENYEMSGLINLYGHFFTYEQTQGASSFDRIICKKEQVNCINFKGNVFSECDIEGDKNLTYLAGKIISHESIIKINSSTPSVGEILVEGEIISDFCIVKKDGETTREIFVLPFKYELDCQNCTTDDKVQLFSRISGAYFKVVNDENQNYSQLTATFNLNFSGILYENCNVDIVTDCFSPEYFITAEKQSLTFNTNVISNTVKQRVFGQAICELESECKLLSLLNGEICNFNYLTVDNQLQISGEIIANLHFEKQNDSAVKIAELPFSIDLPIKNKIILCSVDKHSLTARMQDNKLYLECDIIITLQTKQEEEILSCVSFLQGDKLPQDDSAVNVIFIRKGEDLWSVCKKAKVSQEQLINQNPQNVFPAEKDDYIMVYKQIN
ncbi:MAG: DUF3794 domain-containing protein [Clostridia bacterium]|nr:DUF3794 domain-containing protein [Clostridia bacterium]